MEYVIEQAIAQGEETLRQTVDMNPVLKKAGVVDAGGMGYMVIIRAMLASLRGEVVSTEEQGEIDAAEGSAFDVFDTEDITFAFDTVFIPTSISRHTGPTSTASATALSSARTTRRSRSTCTPTPPAMR